MAYQIFNTDSVGNGIQADLSDTDDMYVKAGVLVGREDAGGPVDPTVYGTGSSHYVRIDGQVAGGGTAIWLGDLASDSGNVVTIGSSGVVHSLSDPAIFMIGHSSTVENAGRIEALGGGVVILNAVAGAGSSRIENSGTIETVLTSIGRSGGTQTMDVFNSGLITSRSKAFDSSGTGTDRFFNTGRIEGDIALGDGDDIYDGRGGTVVGVINGGAGHDTLIGGDGAENFVSGGGIDHVRGGNGNDRYDLDVAGPNFATVVEFAGQGIDTVTANASYTLTAYVEHLNLSGTAGNGTGNGLANSINGNAMANILTGLAGHDRLIGMDGSDRLIGGLGKDMLTGGDQADRFIFTSVSESRTGNGIDKIIDFSRSQGDTIDLKLIDANSTKAGNQAFKFIGKTAFSGTAGELRYQKIGNDTRIEADANGDGTADFTIVSDIVTTFVKGDFIL